MQKNIYLDIDMDYFIDPIEKAAVDNIRLFHDKPCRTYPIAPIIAELKTKGLSWHKENIHCFTNHKKSYTYWWMSKKANCTVIHIDAHSDLYRNAQPDLRLLHNGDLGCYNFLWYAIRDGYIDEIYWVIPNRINSIMNDENIKNIIHPDLVKKYYHDTFGLHLVISYIDIDGSRKEVLLHVCEVEKLPNFNSVCTKVTIATSPEFISEQADDLIFELFEGVGATEEVSRNIYKQHKDMLKKSQADYEAAWEKLGAKRD